MRLLVTAGPTREYFDTVRFISNGSTGKMGYAIARVAHERGHEVVLVSGPVAIDPPPVEVVQVATADEMLAACQAAFTGCHAAVMAAAVADWRPAERLSHKAPKAFEAHTVRLEPTPDICAALGREKGRRVVVGFALQDDEPHRRAEEKMARKQCDAIVLNAPSTLGASSARIEIKVAGEPWGEPLEGGKAELAVAVVALVEQLVAARAS